MQWEQGEVAEVTVCKRFNVRNQNSTHIRTKEVKIPVAYIRVIEMFNKLQEHGITNPSDEAQRRSSCAERMLEELGKKIWSAKVIGKEFRSMVLNPVMQRHRFGVPADYTRTVKRVASGVREPTIRDVIVFYLGRDPVDPAIINSYRRNILYVSEARWHLCVVLGVIAINDPCTFHDVHANTNIILLDLQKNPPGPTKHDLYGVPAYTAMEVNVILHEGLDEFFRDELDTDVG